MARACFGPSALPSRILQLSKCIPPASSSSTFFCKASSMVTNGGVKLGNFKCSYSLLSCITADSQLQSRSSSYTEANLEAERTSSSIQAEKAKKETLLSSDSLTEKNPLLRKRVVSGVQPTGAIHLGNYLGAIKNWISLQELYETLFFVVDLHAITLPHNPEELSKTTRSSAAMYIACGIDPSKASIFVQSHVQAHAELTWLLSCITPISWLYKMIQFKEKSRKTGEDVGTGLLTYPLLMASDILLYQCDLVPVGEDQKQHLELARDVAERFNHLFGGRKWKKIGGRGGKIFKVPEPLIPLAGARIMSLTDGTSKMSKSATSDQSRINLLDKPDDIAYKVKRCKTDSASGMDFDDINRPECNNLLSIYQLVSGKTKEEIAEECKDLNWGQFKPILIDALISHLEPIQRSYHELCADPTYIDNVLLEGATKANEIATSTIQNVYSAMGFFPHQRQK